MDKRKKLKGSHNYFSICIIISILLVVMSLFCYALFDKNAKRTAEANLEYFTQQSFYLIEERLAVIEKIMIGISSDRKIKDFLSLDSYMADVEVRADTVSEIANYRTGENYIRSVFIYNKNEDYVISDSGYSNKLDMFLEYVLEVQQGKREELKKYLLDVTDITVVKYDKIFKNSSFLVLAPIYDLEMGRKCVIGVIVEAHFLEDIIERLKINSQSILLLTNDSGEIISSSSEEMLKDRFFKNEKAEKLSFNSVKYKVFCSISEKYSIKYYNLVPDDMVSADYMTVRNAMIIIIVISSILLIVLLVLFSKKNYKILNAFITRIRNINPDIEGEEVEYIDAAIVGLYEEENRINKLIKENYEILREAIIRQMLSGNIANDNTDEKLMEYLGINIEEVYKRTAIFIFNDKNSANAFFDELKDRYLQDTLPICDKNNVTVIFVNNSDSPDAVINLIGTGCEALQRVGIGNAYKSTEDITKSYKEAREALEYVCDKDDEKIFMYEEIAEVTSNFKKIKWDYMEFIDKITSGEGAKAVVQLLEQKTKETFNENKYIKEEDIKSLLFGLGKSIKEAFNLPDEVNVCSQSELLTISYCELKEMTEKYIVLVGDVLLKNDINIRQRNMVTEYIRSQSGFDFDLNQIASDLGINPSYLSRWFKEYMGETYTDYIKKLKIKEVKRLLTESDLSLEEIAQRVNYSSSSVLAKVFKKETGMTLKTFRENGGNE